MRPYKDPNVELISAMLQKKVGVFGGNENYWLMNFTYHFIYVYRNRFVVRKSQYL